MVELLVDEAVEGEEELAEVGVVVGEAAEQTGVGVVVGEAAEQAGVGVVVEEAAALHGSKM